MKGHFIFEFSLASLKFFMRRQIWEQIIMSDVLTSMLNISKAFYGSLKEETANLSRKVMGIFKKEVKWI